MIAFNGTEPALIGRLAVEAKAADRVHDALLDSGYQCLYRNEDAVNHAYAIASVVTSASNASIGSGRLKKYP